jgi:hypothetical protein
MPSQILHVLFGEDVIAEIYNRLAPRFGVVAGKALEKIQNTHKRVFALGCQGPDIFYHSQGRRPVGLEYGTLLHRRGVGIFTAGLLKMGLPDPPPDEEDIRMNRREKGINAMGVYALGFMTHAILDRKAHPFIVYKSSLLSPPSSETIRLVRFHVFLERIIDVLMLKLLRGAEISNWDQAGLLAETCENPPLGLKELLGKALVLAFPERAGKDEKLSLRIENAFLDAAYFYRLTAPADNTLKSPAALPFSPKKRHLIYLHPEELPAHIDFLNLEKKPWYSPSGGGEEDFRSFPEVYSDAVNAAADSLTRIIDRYLEEGLFPIIEAGQAIGNGGLSIVNEAGVPCAPGRMDPLPLDEVLDQQANLRGIQSQAAD